MIADYDVPYMIRTRDYYRAQGYQSDYQWAHNDNTPFQPLTKPLEQARLVLITTAMPDTNEGRSQRAVYSSPVSPTPKSLYTQDLSWHHGITHTEDVNSFLPIEQVQACVTAGKIGSVAEDFYSVPTEYSQRTTIQKDGPDILKRCQSARADIAILVPL